MADCLKQCGFCCRWLSFKYPNSPEAVEFLRVRGFKVDVIDENTVQALLPAPCQHLRQKANKSVCNIYDKRPQACKDAPCPKTAKEKK